MSADSQYIRRKSYLFPTPLVIETSILDACPGERCRISSAWCVAEVRRPDLRAYLMSGTTCDERGAMTGRNRLFWIEHDDCKSAAASPVT